jgi:fatty acid desaturase
MTAFSAAADPSPFEAAPAVPGHRERPRIDPATLRSLSRLDPLRALSDLAFEWAAIAAAVWICEAYWHPALYALAVVWIGARQHALAIMAHDGAHALILPRRAWNDAVTQLLMAWPVGMSLPAYRRMHRLHHRYLNSERDPDWARNRPDRLATRRSVAGFARVMLGLNAEQRQVAGLFRGRADDGVPRALVFARFAYWAAIVATAAAFGWLQLLLLYWIVPLFSWFLVTMRLKGTAEHFAVEDEEAANAARTVLPNFLERWLVAPRNIHYHIEHHLYPSVPLYRLPALHAALMELPAYRSRAHVTHGYWNHLRECWGAAR